VIIIYVCVCRCMRILTRIHEASERKREKESCYETLLLLLQTSNLDPWPVFSSVTFLSFGHTVAPSSSATFLLTTGVVSCNFHQSAGLHSYVSVPFYFSLMQKVSSMLSTLRDRFFFLLYTGMFLLRYASIFSSPSLFFRCVGSSSPVCHDGCNGWFVDTRFCR